MALQMRSLGGKIRSRLFYKALDAVVTAPLRVKRRFAHRLWRLLSPRSSNYDRVAAMVHVFDDLAPGVAGRWSGRLLDFGQLPLSCEVSVLYAYGSGATVFLLQGEQLPLILKVYRRSLGWSGQKLLQMAKVYRKKYETVCRWYGDGPVRILPAWYFILNAPLLTRPAVGLLQPYAGPKKRDLFLDFDETTLRLLLENEDGLRAQLAFFCRRTLNIARREGRCLDLVGRDNVTVLADDGGNPELVILDYGHFEMAAKKRDAPSAYARLQWRLEKLKTLLDFIEDSEPVQTGPAVNGNGA